MLYSIQDQNQPENIYLLKVFDVSDIFSLLLPPVGAGQVSAQFYILSPLYLWVSLCPSPLLSLSPPFTIPQPLSRSVNSGVTQRGTTCSPPLRDLLPGQGHEERRTNFTTCWQKREKQWPLIFIEVTFCWALERMRNIAKLAIFNYKCSQSLGKIRIAILNKDSGFHEINEIFSTRFSDLGFRLGLFNCIMYTHLERIILIIITYAIWNRLIQKIDMVRYI